MDEMINIPKTFGNLSEIKRITPIIVKREFGPGSFISGFEEDRDNSRIFFNIGVKYPIEIEDDERIFFRIKNIPDIDTISFEKNDNGVFTYKMNSFSEFESLLLKKDILIIQSLERELIKNTYESLAKIPAVANTMTPLVEIANQFRFNDIVKKSMVIKSRKNQSQMENYIKFMVRKGYITIDLEDIKPTKKLQRILNSRENISIPIISESLKSGYTELFNFLHLSGLKPYLTIANAYYTPSTEAKNLLRLSVSNLSKYYRKIYKVRSNAVKLANQVSMMSEVNIFNIDQKLIYGQQSILDKQVNLLNNIS
jgi:hypothetical protein